MIQFFVLTTLWIILSGITTCILLCEFHAVIITYRFTATLEVESWNINGISWFMSNTISICILINKYELTVFTTFPVSWLVTASNVAENMVAYRSFWNKLTIYIEIFKGSLSTHRSLPKPNHLSMNLRLLRSYVRLRFIDCLVDIWNSICVVHPWL